MEDEFQRAVVVAGVAHMSDEEPRAQSPGWTRMALPPLEALVVQAS